MCKYATHNNIHEYIHIVTNKNKGPLIRLAEWYFSKLSCLSYRGAWYASRPRVLFRVNSLTMAPHSPAGYPSHSFLGFSMALIEKGYWPLESPD